VPFDRESPHCFVGFAFKVPRFGARSARGDA
jgi:hypothetical protein